MKSIRQNGFALIFSMLVLVLLTIVVVSGARTTLLNEWMAGSYMDRTRAYQAAEQSIQQAKALMTATVASVDYGELCLGGCAVSAAKTVTASTVQATALPAVWSDVTAATMDQTSESTAGGPLATGKYFVTQLNNTFLPSDRLALGCKAYSIVGRGQGLDSRTVVVLQTVAFVCPV